MGNCTYIIGERDGDFYIEIPSISDSRSKSDFENSFKEFLSGNDPKEFLKSLNAIDKKLILPDTLKNIVLGQDSLGSVYTNFSDSALKSKFSHLVNILNDY